MSASIGCVLFVHYHRYVVGCVLIWSRSRGAPLRHPSRQDRRQTTTYRCPARGWGAHCAVCVCGSQVASLLVSGSITFFLTARKGLVFIQTIPFLIKDVYHSCLYGKKMNMQRIILFYGKDRKPKRTAHRAWLAFPPAFSLYAKLS